MKKLFVVALAVGSLAGALWAHEGHEGKKEAGKDITITGEVLDLSCYLGGGGEMGKDHAKCAKACLTGKGAPAGLMTKDGKVYLLVADHGAEKAFKDACNLGGQQAKVTGHLNEKGGLQAILVEKVEKL